jgi:hypothetical protein
MHISMHASNWVQSDALPNYIFIKMSGMTLSMMLTISSVHIQAVIMMKHIIVSFR